MAIALVALVPAIAAASAHVRVAHLSPDAPNVDVRVDGTVVLSDVPFGAISDVLTLSGGTYDVEVFVAGTTNDPVIAAPVTVQDGVAYTIAATGLVGAQDLAPLILVDDTNALSTDAKVRVTHASPDAPTVDVAVANGGPVLFSALSFRDSSGYEVVAPGTVDLELRLAGTSTVALPIGPVTFEAGTVIDVFARGLVADASLTVTPVVTATAGPARVRIGHLSPDAPAVDVLVDGSVVLSGVTYPAVSDYLELPGGSYGVQVRATASPTTVVIDETVSFLPGVAYSVAATGLLGQNDLTPLPLSDDRTSDPVNAKVRFVHLGPDAPPVDVALAGGAVLFGNTAFRGASGYQSIAPGTYDLEVRLAGTSTVVLPLPGVEIAAGTNVSVFAIGLVGENTLQAFPAVDVDDRFVRGDVDRNGTVDLSDAIRALLYVSGAPVEELCLDAIDVDDDGHVQLDDPLALLGYLFGGGPPPFAPFAALGTDTTADAIGCDR